MKLIIFEDGKFEQFYPLTYMRPVCDLRCGQTTLREKVERAAGRKADAVFVREWLADAYAARATAKVNDLSVLQGDDLLLVNGRALWLGGVAPETSRDVCALAGDEVVALSLTRETAENISADSFAAFLRAAVEVAPGVQSETKLAAYPWDLIDHNAEAICDDFRLLGKSGVEGTLAEGAYVWGPQNQVYVAPGAVIEPTAVIDTTEGPVIIEEGVRVNPHTRIEGPASIGRDTVLFGGKIREGTAIGPVCRVGGEVEEAIMHGYANKYHDGFLGHGYICPWVNLGAGTTNSDLKNDYGTVEVKMNGQLMDTGSMKVGCFIGDFTKTSIGTLVNTGTIIGMMSNILGAGCLLPKTAPSFVMFMDNKFFKAGKKQLVATARTAMGRRKMELLPAEEALLEYLFTLTRDERMMAVKKSRKELMAQKGISL